MMAMDERTKDQLASLFRREFSSLLYAKGAARKSIGEIAAQVAAGPGEFRQMAGALVARMGRDMIYASPAELEALFYEIIGLKDGTDEAAARMAEAVKRQAHETFESLGEELSGIGGKIAQRKESVKKVPEIISDAITRNRADDPEIARKIARALFKNGIFDLRVVNDAIGKGTSWEFLYSDILNGKGEFGGPKKLGLNDVFLHELKQWENEHQTAPAKEEKPQPMPAPPVAAPAQEKPKPEATTPAAPQAKAAAGPAHAALPAQPATPEPAPKPEAAAPKPVARNPDTAEQPAYAAPKILSTPAPPEKDEPAQRIAAAIEATEKKKAALEASGDPTKKREIRHLEEAMASLRNALSEISGEKPQAPVGEPAHKQVPDSFQKWVKGAATTQGAKQPQPKGQPKKASPIN